MWWACVVRFGGKMPEGGGVDRKKGVVGDGSCFRSAFVRPNLFHVICVVKRMTGFKFRNGVRSDENVLDQGFGV
jgi:hypothetical protein